jgi:peptide/nickel transport system substrate-binding protein
LIAAGNPISFLLLTGFGCAYYARNFLENRFARVEEIMTEHDNFWTRRRISRRSALRGGALGIAGLAGAALIGCGDDEADPAPAAATAAPAATSAAKAAPTSAASTATAVPTGQVDTEAELRVGYGSFPSSLDMTTAAGTGGQAASNSYHYGGLLGTGADGNAAQGGFADYEWRDDNRTLRFKLLPGIEFHNGEKLDATQLKFQYDRSLSRAAYNPDFVGAQKPRQIWIKDVLVVDDLTVDMTMEEPFRNAPQESIIGPVPMEWIRANGDEAYAINPISTGPMIFESWIPDSEIVSVRNEKYPFPRDSAVSHTASWAKRIVGKFIPEEQARLAALEAGEIDIAYRIGPDLANSFKGKEGYNVIGLPDVRVMALELPINASVDPITGGANLWRDKRVRQAANYAIDTDSIIKNLLTGNEGRGYSPFPRGGYPLPLGSLEAPYNYDPERARALLEEAGAVGMQFDILLAQGLWTSDRLWMPAIQKMLNDVGFKVSVKYSPLSEALQAMRSRTHLGPFIFNQGSTTAGAGYKSADTAYGLIATTGAAYGHTDEGDDFLPEFMEFQALIDEARTRFDTKERADLFQKAAIIHYENAFNVSMFNLSHLYVTTANIDYTEFYDVPTGMNLMRAKKLFT